MEEPVFVLITEPFSAEIVDQLQAISPRLELHVHPANKLEEVPPSLLARAEVLYTLRIVPAPEQAPNLKWIQFHQAGLDRFADSPILHRGVEFTSLSGAAAPQIAEYIVMMLLALGHRLPDLLGAQAAREWPRDKWEKFAPRELRGSTVGIVGYGSVGRETARLCNAFGARVLAVKRDVMAPDDGGYSPEGVGDPEGRIPARIYPPQAAKRMLAECDFVIVCAPLTSATQAWFGAEMIAAMREGACLVGISRGGIIDEAALRSALAEGKLRGAALDVFAREPLPAEDPLWESPRLFLTPHIAGHSPLYDARASLVFAENLRRYLSRQPLVNRLDPQRGY
ncbi:MAG: D-2-hydroxyacid dehydrogenase [Anaerolineales bacterium]|nr:D-2-hydroxyacid dehydrogenase [Anaerolineales bacterium]